MPTDPTPDPPIPLGPTARARWDALYAANAARGRGAWRHDLAAYCAAWGRWHDAEAVLSAPESSIITITDDKGNVKSVSQAPEIRVSADALKLCRDLAQRLVID